MKTPGLHKAVAQDATRERVASGRTWSPQQQAIFAWFKMAVGNLVVRARAGTGKTTTILAALGHIPGAARILVCAFNKRIAVELTTKMQDARAEAKTLHAVGFAMVRASMPRVRLDVEVEDDRLYKAADRMGVMLPSEIFPYARKLVSVAKGAAPFASVDDLMDLARTYQCEPENGAQAQGWDTSKLAQLAWNALDVAAKMDDPKGRISFDDMLFLPVVRGMRGAQQYEWVIVDEAQDMNASQLILAQRSCKPGGHVVVVGDDMQAIYGFRGADSGAIDRLKGELGAMELGLTTTYRCPRRVVEVAQALVPDYHAAPGCPEGYVASLPVDQLGEWAGAGQGVPMAVLSRVNAPLVSIALGLIRRGTAARIEGRDIGKALAERARKLAGKTDSVPEFLERLAHWQQAQVARIVASKKQVEKRTAEVEDTAATLEALADGCVSVREILQRCERMFSDTIGHDGTVNRAPAVVCSSVHRAKGLEWPVVFVLEDTLYCGGKRVDQEERNIHYVAVTRAMETLVMVAGR